MMFVLCLLAVLESSALTPASAHNVCDKPPDPSLMKKVLRPTAKVLLDCVADVLILHKVNTSFLNKVVIVVCEYHVECYQGLRDIKDMLERRRIAGECMLKNFFKRYPTFESTNGAEGMDVIKKLMVCLHSSDELLFEEDDVTSAVMHWVFGLLKTGS
ncbi:uncharacterized protein LOC119388839 [Rhipicephalus sanguineus]|uniref:uncharacterized protein LOC119388839 n=1 Tax=Rhipicephalus sanguineus TaxID=34632 RepID=UPI0018951233|nr:uncharacterized protein LOC119388839 [Rhipicephalus sanguineus]